MKQSLIIAILTAALLGAVFVSGTFYGMGLIKDSKSTEIVKEATNEAKRYANRPRTDDDVTRRLCDWIKRTESKDRSQRRPPEKACQ